MRLEGLGGLGPCVARFIQLVTQKLKPWAGTRIHQPFCMHLTVYTGLKSSDIYISFFSWDYHPVFIYLKRLNVTVLGWCGWPYMGTPGQHQHLEGADGMSDFSPVSAVGPNDLRFKALFWDWISNGGDQF